MPHIHRQAASIAMLPKPVRDERKVSQGLPIILQDRYILDIETSLLAVNDSVATLQAEVYTGRSGTFADDTRRVEFPADSRFARIEALWTHLEDLPPEIANSVQSHRDLLLVRGSIGIDAERAVQSIIKELEAADISEYIPGADPLDILETLAGIERQVEIPLPTEAPPGSPEIRLRLESAWRLRRDRGQGHIQFKRAVQRAYRMRCAFCGLTAVRVGQLAPYGLDAAHILPWSEYDIDHVTNGLLLCKTDHWLFDRHVLTLSFENGVYQVDLNPSIKLESLQPASRKIIEKALGAIPEHRLPNSNERPEPEFIKALYDPLEAEGDG